MAPLFSVSVSSLALESPKPRHLSCLVEPWEVTTVVTLSVVSRRQTLAPWEKNETQVSECHPNSESPGKSTTFSS